MKFFYREIGTCRLVQRTIDKEKSRQDGVWDKDRSHKSMGRIAVQVWSWSMNASTSVENRPNRGLLLMPKGAFFLEVRHLFNELIAIASWVFRAAPAALLASNWVFHTWAILAEHKVLIRMAAESTTLPCMGVPTQYLL